MKQSRFTYLLITFLCLTFFLAQCNSSSTADEADATNPVTTSCGEVSSQDISTFQASDGLYTDKVNMSWEAPFLWSAIDNDGSVGAQNSLVIDGDGTLHASYKNLTGAGAQLKYAYKTTSGCWVTETADETAGEMTDILVDSSGTVYVSYYDSDNQQIMLATRSSSGTWSTEVVDLTVSTGLMSTSLTLENNTLHIAHDGGAGGLIHSWKSVSGTTWENETVTSSVSQHVKMASESDGTLHILYRVSSSGGLSHASKEPSGSWTFTTVETGQMLDIDLNTASTSWDTYLLASYYDFDNGSLKFAWKSSTGSWNTETVDTSGDSVGKYSSVTSTTSAAPLTFHISYYDATNSSLKHAYRTSTASSWTKETLDSDQTTGQYTSIALDSSELVHITYYDMSVTAFNYATTSSSDLTYTLKRRDEDGLNAWTTLGTSTSTSYDDETVVQETVYQFGIDVTGNDETITDNGYAAAAEIVDSSADVGYWTDTAVATDGTIHVSYHDDENRDLKHAWKSAASTTWNVQTVDSDDRTGEYTSLVIAPNGDLHISYFEFEDRDLRHAHGTWTGSTWSWTTENVDTTDYVGQYSSIAADPTGDLHISYYLAGTDLELKHAHGIWNGTVWSWTTEVVDTADNVGKWSQIAVENESNGNLHISYFDDTNDWTTETVDTGSGNVVGEFTSIYVTADDRIHIAYHDDDDEQLQHAWKDLGDTSWNISLAEEPTTFGSSGRYTGMVIGSNGNVYISHWATSDDRLALTTGVWDGSSSYTWTSQILDDSVAVIGMYTSIAQGTDGALHISYYDSTNGALKYVSSSP